MKQFYTLLFILLTTPNIIHAQTNNWDLIESNNNMEVYSRMPEDSQYKELKIKLNVEAPLSSVIAVLDNVDNYTDWIYSCTEAFFVKKKVDGKSKYYVQMDFPWPLSDRDMVMNSVMTQDTETLEIKIDSKAIEGYVDEREDVVRITDGLIKWRIKPISTSTSQIEYYVKSYPGGQLPGWLVNMSISLGPKKTMSALREKVEKIEVPKDKIYIKDF